MVQTRAAGCACGPNEWDQDSLEGQIEQRSSDFTRELDNDWRSLTRSVIRVLARSPTAVDMSLGLSEAVAVRREGRNRNRKPRA